MTARARITAALLVVLAVALVAAQALARPGGGQSFRSSSSGGSRSYGTPSSGGSRSWSTSSSSSSSGGSRSYSTSSSSSSSGSTPTYTSPTYVPPPTYGSSYGTPTTRSEPLSRTFLAVVVVLALVVLLLVVYGRRRERQRQEWVARAEAEERAAEARVARWSSIDRALAAIRSADDAFSYVLFEDFLYALYGEAHSARGKPGALDGLAAYLSDDARMKLTSLGTAGVDAVVIGGMRVDEVRSKQGEPYVWVTVTFTTNVSERTSQGETAFYMEERWRLVRHASAKSRAPARARTVDCPSCGAPRDKTIGGKCGYCGAAPTRGQTDWFVEAIDVLAREARAPMLTGTTEEVGTDLPTVVAPDVKPRLAQLMQADPAFAWQGFVARVERTFAAFHESWSAQDLATVRPYLSDNLYELQRYWVNAYRAQGLRNVTEEPRIVSLHLARVTQDRYFHAITVRVFASCLDYTLDREGKVVGGSRTSVRDYSEYWTFVRGIGVRGAPRSDAACPSCGAPQGGIDMAGVCTHCNAKVTNGQFDWALSRIEQDEVYEAAA